MTPAQPIDDQVREFYRRNPGRRPMDEKPDLPIAQGAPTQPQGTVLPRVPVDAPETPQAPQRAAIPMAAFGQPGEAPSAAQQRLSDLQARGSGISRIHNPVGRVFARVGDVLAGTFAPRAEQLIPGTEGNYGMQLARAGNAVKGEQEQAKEESEAGFRRAQTENLESEANVLHPAQAEEARARSHALLNPQDKEQHNVHSLYADAVADAIKRGVDPKDDPAVKQTLAAVTAMAEKPEKADVHVLLADAIKDALGRGVDPNEDPKVKQLTTSIRNAAGQSAGREGELPLGDFAAQMNAANQERYQVLHQGAQLPSQYMLTPNSTQKQADEIKSLLGGTESAEGVKTARTQAAATAAANRGERTEHDTRKAAYEAWKPTLDSAERFNVMTKNYEDAVKNHDQQAMLSLLANHLGMTMGLQKGARLTRDIIQEAQRSRPWLQGLVAKFDKDGYLSGITLTPDQMRQMVNLGRERFSEDRAKSQSEARYMGSQDQGPDRIPNKSTINHYIALANGDATKAKQMATEDGWSIH